MHLSEPIGAFNTFVLICSSVTIVLGLEAARANKADVAKGLLVLTLVLGGLFLGVKMYEYTPEVHARHLSGTPHSRMYEQPDVYYALGRARAAQQQRGPRQADRIESSARR